MKYTLHVERSEAYFYSVGIYDSEERAEEEAQYLRGILPNSYEVFVVKHYDGPDHFALSKAVE